MVLFLNSWHVVKPRDILAGRGDICLFTSIFASKFTFMFTFIFKKITVCKRRKAGMKQINAT